MQYHVLGGDGRQYGPIDIQTLRRWADEGRVKPETQVRDDATGLVSSAYDILQTGGLPQSSGLPTKACPNCGFQCDITQSHCPNCGAFLGMAQVPPGGVPSNEAAARKILGMSVAGCVVSCIVVAIVGIVLVVLVGVGLLTQCSKL